MRTGRRRKSTVTRSSTGKSLGEPKDDILSVARVYRTREVGPENATNALAGFTLGRLLLRGRASPGAPDGVSEAQFSAGERWATICRTHSAIHGYSMGLKSPSVLMLGGASLADPPDEDRIATIRRQWRDCYDALMAAGRTHNVGTRVALLCWDVCVDQRRVETLTPDDFGILRVGLNTLRRILG